MDTNYINFRVPSPPRHLPPSARTGCVVPGVHVNIPLLIRRSRQKRDRFFYKQQYYQVAICNSIINFMRLCYEHCHGLWIRIYRFQASKTEPSLDVLADDKRYLRHNRRIGWLTIAK